ncbi:MAG: hypothetical protein DWH98_03845 [Planctomycetota bacterium]|nr:MAG: hypothetical protein DWH98_03845 [Planctomycetota bacterium]
MEASESGSNPANTGVAKILSRDKHSFSPRDYHLNVRHQAKAVRTAAGGRDGLHTYLHEHA